MRQLTGRWTNRRTVGCNSYTLHVGRLSTRQRSEIGVKVWLLYCLHHVNRRRKRKKKKKERISKSVSIC